MARNNDVFQVLVTSKNQNILGVGNKITSLQPGQLGVFDFDTNISIDGSLPVRNFYLAVGVDKDGDGVIDDVVKSRGSHIQKRNIVYYSYRPHTAGKPMKVVLKDYTAECETEYGIKLEFRNQNIYTIQGYNQFTKTYSIVTSCCNGCQPTCPSGDANEITSLLYQNVMNDSTGLVKVHILPRGDVSAAGVTPDPITGYLTLADLATIMAYNATQPDPSTYVYTDLEFETVTQAINTFCQINLNYLYPREGVVIASKIMGFKCNGTLEVTQNVSFEEGSGYDIKQLEYMALGWDVSPYRLSALNGVAQERAYNTDVKAKYDMIALTYDQHSIGAWLEYLNNEATMIAIPTTDTDTRTSLLNVLDLIAQPLGFDTLSDDAAISNPDITISEPTTDINDVNLDGIG